MMSVSGIVLTLSGDEDEAANARVLLDGEPWLELGSPHGVRCPAVIDAPSAREARELVKRLEQIPGVTFVDVVFTSVDEPGTQVASFRAECAEISEPNRRMP